MRNTTILSAVLSILIPLTVSLVRNTKKKRIVLVAYAIGILYLTIGNRLFSIMLGRSAFDTVRQLDLTPFWSYARLDQADVRWQIYMNVFLYIPFGFLLPWGIKKMDRLWKVVLIAFGLSIITEVIQYFFRIGLCETDDVIHNTLGAVIGFGYWRLLCRIQVHFRGDQQ